MTRQQLTMKLAMVTLQMKAAASSLWRRQPRCTQHRVRMRRADRVRSACRYETSTMNPRTRDLRSTSDSLRNLHADVSKEKK